MKIRHKNTAWFLKMIAGTIKTAKNNSISSYPIDIINAKYYRLSDKSFFLGKNIVTGKPKLMMQWGYENSTNSSTGVDYFLTLKNKKYSKHQKWLRQNKDKIMKELLQ